VLLFPFDLHPIYGYSEGADTQALVMAGRGPIRQVRESLLVPVFSAEAVFQGSPAKEAQLEAFWRSVRGPAVAFWFYSRDPWRTYTGLDCGTGDGSTLAFYAPIRSLRTDVAPTVVKVAGVTKTEGVDYDLGPDEAVAPYRTGVVFKTGKAPADEASVTLDGAGRRLYVVAFDAAPLRVTVPRFRAYGVKVNVSEVTA
jgi:hypothetical protein